MEMENQISKISDERFTDKSFLFTGKMNTLKRDEAEQAVRDRGGRVASSVSAKLDILVVGENAGSKLDKAKKLGSVKIMSEQEFLQFFQ